MKFKNFKDGASWIDSRIERAENRFLDHLEGEDRDVAQKIFATHKPALKGAFQQIGEARRDFGHAIKQETPSSEALTAALNKSQAATTIVNESFHSVMRELAQDLSVEARQNIGRGMRRHEHDD
jgi:uncharacterized membrane protein